MLRTPAGIRWRRLPSDRSLPGRPDATDLRFRRRVSGTNHGVFDVAARRHAAGHVRLDHPSGDLLQRPEVDRRAGAMAAEERTAAPRAPMPESSSLMTKMRLDTPGRTGW